MLSESKIEKNKTQSSNRKKNNSLTPEENVRQEFIALLVNKYGYLLEQMSEEEQFNSSQSHNIVRADIVVWKSIEDKKKKRNPIFIVQCKSALSLIREKDYFQGIQYAQLSGSRIFIAANQKNTKYFKVLENDEDKIVEELVDIPHAKDWKDENIINNILSKINRVTRDEFSKTLFRCHNIIRNNDKLSPEAAFDEISKILFMKILYEREHTKERTLYIDDYHGLKKAYIYKKAKEKGLDLDKDESLREKYLTEDSLQVLPFYKYLFEKTKNAFVLDEIFEPNDIVKVRETSFLQIVKELEQYNLSYISDDIKGIAFEEFLGRTFRGELGQFFTPRTIVDYMVDILDPEEGELVCDPCCGSGGFLIKAFEYIREKIENDIENQKEKIETIYFTKDFYDKTEKEQEIIIRKVDELYERLNYELDLYNPQSRLKKLSYDCVFGTDANPRMARTAKMNMIMHGDGHGGVHHHDGLLNVNGIFDGRFDVILTNPPFGSRVEKSLKVTQADIPEQDKLEHYKKRYPYYESIVINPLSEWAKKEKPIIDIFEVGKMSSLTEVLFLDRCLNLLKPGGRMGIVLPEGVLNNSALQKVREYFEGKAKILNITSIPQDVFIASGATVKPSLVFLKKFTDAEAVQYKMILEDAATEMSEKYKIDIEKIESQFVEKENLLRESKDKDSLTNTRKAHKNAMRHIEQQLADDIRSIVKERFDYQIPVVEVEKAGISSTGAKIENELIEVAEEFRKYRMTNNLWKSKLENYNYPIIEDKILRSNGVNEPEVFYGQSQ
jgi:type I restriction enzyme M protein